MKRGSVSSGRAAATAGLKRSVWPTASATLGVGRRRDQLVGFGERSRHRLFDEHRDAGVAETAARCRGAARSAPRRVTASTWPSSSRVVEHRAASRSPAAISSRARAVGVDDGDQLDARQRRQDPRVVLAEMADADDRYSQSSLTRRFITKARKYAKTTKHLEAQILFVSFVLFVTS